ncbi:hypothetical protein B0H14DRAFT_2780876 [Mycena olivaceomarginata]|nr:hypothetical protein B0H14DRAFT_2780876 [Mycena olivaceomarginata]
MAKRKVNRDSDASPSEDSASVSDGSDFEGRPRKQVAIRRGAGKKAAAVKPKASAGPRLKKSTKPEWNRVRTFLLPLCPFLEVSAERLVPRQAGNRIRVKMHRTVVCTAVVKDSRSREKPGEFSVKVFDMNNSKIKGTTAQKITDFEEQFFGSSDWLDRSHNSPLKLFNFLCAAGTVLHYKEENQSTVTQAGTKFKFFQGESEGQELRKSEDELFLQLEKDKFGALGKDEEVCMPQRLLLLAKKDSTDK